MLSVMQPFKYGINPEQRAQFRDLSGIEVIVGELSFNAYMDLYLGTSALAVPHLSQFSFLYVKHKMPVIAVGANTESEAVEAFLLAARQVGNVEFGCLIANFSLSDASLLVLQTIRMHTVAAIGFSKKVVQTLKSPLMQYENRGLTVIVTQLAIRNFSTKISYEGGGIVLHEGSCVSEEFDRQRAVSNQQWQEPQNLELGIAVLRHTRTIGVCILEQGVVRLVRCGFYDGLEAIEETLKRAADQNIDLCNAVILSDGCFGVKSPTRYLLQHGVQGFVFCGGKQNDIVLLDELNQAGIGALCTKVRYFYY